MKAKATKKDPRFDSAWEAQYHARLTAMQEAGEIACFWWKGMRFAIGGGQYYKPEAVVQLPNGELEVHEVKGYRREAGMIRFRTAASIYPFVFKLIGKKKSEWIITEER